MFTRLVQIRVKEGFIPAVTRLYEKLVLGSLNGAMGCRYASLLASHRRAEECLAFTLWETEEEALACERGGLLSSLLEQAGPFLVPSSESRLQLSDDLRLEYVEVTETPSISSLPVAAGGPAPGQPGTALWLRLVSLRVRPGRLEEFKRLYTEKAIPALRSLEGCRFIYLLEVPDRPSTVISVTGWDRREAAEEYERTGMFDRLLEAQKDLLSDLYRWKREQDAGTTSVTSDDLTVDHYAVLCEKVYGTGAGSRA